MSDVWALGVIAYQLVYGRVPWKDKDDHVLYDMIMGCPVERLFDSDKQVSDHYKKFIKNCYNEFISNTSNPKISSNPILFLYTFDPPTRSIFSISIILMPRFMLRPRAEFDICISA